MNIDTPFPVEGTITPTEHGYAASLPCESEWLTEGETDYLQAAVDRAARKYGEGVDVLVEFHGSSDGLECSGYTIYGPTEEGGA